MKYSIYQDEPASKVKEEGAMVHPVLHLEGSLAVGKLDNGDEAAGALDDPGTPTEAKALAEQLCMAEHLIGTVLDMLPERAGAARVLLTAYFNRGTGDGR
jgi:hypothetical protein